MNCPNCGAVIKEGKFCNYCGARILDDTKKVEVTIHKRIEDAAELKRAEYETQESLLRQKRMKRDLRKGKIKWIVCGALMLIGFLCSVFHWSNSLGLALLVGVPIYIIVSWVNGL